MIFLIHTESFGILQFLIFSKCYLVDLLSFILVNLIYLLLLSIRWKTLLSFNCRNRLLLTGTPIQNNMAELWALLHFIMPTLFDSHEQFNEWFSKGYIFTNWLFSSAVFETWLLCCLAHLFWVVHFCIRIENHAEHGGTLNEHQLNRLVCDIL